MGRLLTDEEIQDINDRWALRPNFAVQRMLEAQAKLSIQEVVEWVEKHGGLVNTIEGDDPEYGHTVQYIGCRDDLSPEEYRMLGTAYRFVIHLTYDEWQEKRKEWGID